MFMFHRIALIIFSVLAQSGLCDQLDDFHAQLRNFAMTRPPQEAAAALEIQGMANVVHASRSFVTKRDVNEEATPVVQMHGMGDFAQDPFGMVPLAEDISAYLGGAYVLNVQIGDSSFFMNMDDQVDYFASVVQNDAHLVNGFNAIGYSQGNLLIRGYIERYNNPPVLNFISMHGPLAGVAGFPGCSPDHDICVAFDELLGALAYYPRVQEGLAQANYYRDPMKIDTYLTNDTFLADINNERTNHEEYASHWLQLESICLVKAKGDTVVIPNESEWFGAYQDGSLYEEIWSFDETPWYLDDLFGLRSLNEAGRVYFNVTEGNHLDFSTDYLLELVGIYFE